MTTGLSIGDFSRITHLSVKTLRHYHEAGLLEPDAVDPHSGYRIYALDQVPTAQVIRRFRELDMPVAEISRVLGTTDPSVRAELIAGHLDRLEARLEQTRAAVVSLRRLLAPAPAPIDVELRPVAAFPALAVRATVDLDGVLGWYPGAMADIDAVRGGDAATGPAGGLFDDALFAQERGEILVYRPVARPRAAGRVEVFEVPAAELALTVHAGPHDDIDVTYGTLGAWVAEQALAVAGPVRETYLVGPADTADPTAWRTEIGWPVFRTTAA